MSTVHCNHPNDKLSIEEWGQIEARMYPGKASLSGFLQPDEKLSTIIQKDLEYLNLVGITTKQISDRLLTIHKKYIQQRYLNYKAGTESDGIVIENKFLVKTKSYMGAQECPFQNKTIDNKYHGYSYGDTDVTITNVSTNESITFNTLLIHMIEQHFFFEGSVEHRLEPADVIRVLEIKPDIDYSPVFKTEYFWSAIYATSFTNFFSNKNLEILQHYSCKYEFIKTPEKEIYAYIFPADIIDGSDWVFIETAYHSKQSYREMRQMVLHYKNYADQDLVKKGLISKVKTAEEIEKKINMEERLMARYKETGDLENMVMILFATGPVKNTRLFNISCMDGFSGESHYRCNKREYVDP